MYMAKVNRIKKTLYLVAFAIPLLNITPIHAMLCLQAPRLASRTAYALAPSLERKLAHSIHTQALALTQQKRRTTPQEQANQLQAHSILIRSFSHRTQPNNQYNTYEVEELLQSIHTKLDNHETQSTTANKLNRTKKALYFLGGAVSYAAGSALLSRYIENSGDWVVTEEKDPSGNIVYTKKWSKSFAWSNEKK